MRGITPYVVCLFLFIISSAHVLHAEDDIEIGVLASLTGNWAEIGKNIQQGVTLAAEEVNRTGGALGKPLVFNFQDTDEEKSGAKVISGYRYLQTKGIKLFIGPTGVPGIMALTPVAAKDDMVLVAPTSTNAFYKTSSHFFNASGDNYDTTKATAELAYRKGVRKAAIFGSLQPWESDQAKIFREVFTALGGTIVSEVAPAAGQTDLKVEALKIRTSNPEAVFFAIFNNIPLAAKSLKQHKYANAQFAALLDESHIVGSEGGLEGTLFHLFNQPGEDFIQKYKQRFGSAPGVFADSAYDAAISLAEGIKTAGEVSPSKIAKAMHSIQFIGSSGKLVEYSLEGLLKRNITLHRVKNGKVVPVPVN